MLALGFELVTPTLLVLEVTYTTGATGLRNTRFRQIGTIFCFHKPTVVHTAYSTYPATCLQGMRRRMAQNIPRWHR